MKRISVLFVTIIMVMLMSLTAQAKTRDDKYDETAKKINDRMYYEITESDDYKQLKKEFEDDFEVTVIDSKIDTGIYDFNVIISVEEDVMEGHFIVDITEVDLEQFNNMDEESTLDLPSESLEYYKFNNRRVTSEFVVDYLDQFITE